MVKAYLHRYEPALSFGVVASPDSNVVHDPSGRLLLAAALDRFAAWDLKRGLPSAIFTPSASSSLALAVSCLASSPAAASIASGHADGSIRLWDAETGACEATLHGHRSAASALRFAPSGAVLASGSKDCDVILWDVVAQAGLFRLRGHRDQVTDLLFLDSGKKLVTCSKDKFMRVWDLDTQHCLQIVGGHHSEIWSMDVDPAEKFLVSGSADPELRVFRIRQSADEGEDWNKWDALKLFGEIPRQTIERVQTIRFSKDGSLVACQVAGKTADIYRILDEAEAKTRLHSKKEKATVIDPLSAQDSQNPTLVVTDVFKLLQVLRTSNKICSLAFSPSNPPKGCLATLSLSLNNNVLQTYSVDNDKVSKMYSVEIHGHRSAIRSLSLNSEDNLLMSTSHNAVKIWNPSTGNCLRTIDSGYGLCSAFVPGNRYGLVGTKTGTLEIIDINSGNSVDVIEAHSGSIQSIVLIPDEDGTVNARGFVTGSADHDVKFWEYQLVQKSYSDTKHLSVTNVRTLKMNDDVLAVSIGPTGKHIAVALLDCTVKVFFLDTLKCCLSLYGHELPVLCMDISSDGAFIVTGSAEKNLKIWGMDFGDCHKSIFAHTDSVMDVKFVPRTHYMFSVGKDRTVKYWDADKFELLLTLEGHHAEVWCLAVSSRGDFIVTGSHDRSIRRWDRTEEQLFIEEEREKRLEESFEADLDNAVEDRYGQKDDAPEEGSVGFPGKKTKETITAADAIIDALDTAEEEEKRRNEQKAQPAPPIALVAPATSFATPTQAPVSTAETAPPTAQPQAALPATVAASSRNNRINWDEDATTLFAQICFEEIIQSNIVGKPSKDGQERIRLRLLEEGNVNCSIPQVSNKWDAMKKLYNFYNKVKELPVEMQKKHFKTYANKMEYQKLKDGPPKDIKLMEIMFGNKEELPEKPNLTDEKAVMPASFGEVMKLAEVNKESSEKLSKKLEGVIEKLKDLRMLSKSIEQEVVALQMEFRNDMCNIGSVLRRLVYAAEKYYEVVAENQRFTNELQELEGGAEPPPLAMKKPAGRSVAGRTTAGRSVAGRTSFQAGRSAGRSVAGGGEATAKRMQKTTSRIGRLPPMKSANCKPKPPKTPDPGGPKSLGGRLFRREEEVEAGEQRETRRRVLSCLSQILEVPSLSEEGSSVVKRNSLKQKQENNAKLAGGCCQ